MLGGDVILHSVFMDRNFRWRYFDYFTSSCLKGDLLVVRLSLQTLSGRFCHRWPFEVDELYCGKGQWVIASFPIMIVLYRRCDGFPRFSVSWPIVAIRSSSHAFIVCGDIVSDAPVGKVVVFSKVVVPEGVVINEIRW